MKKKDKGFTLIELLTVIAILAVILLIAAPTILGVLDKARKNTFKNQVLLYVESVKTQMSLKQMGAGYADVTSSELSCSIDSNNVETCTIMIKDVPMENHSLADGLITIQVKNGNATYELLGVSDGVYEYSGSDKEIDAKNIEKADNKEYKIGDEVTLLDGTTWYVIENSDSTRNTVTLFASKNMKNDASGWTTIQSEFRMAFDKINARTTEKNSYCTNPSNGCNIYAANGSTVKEDSTIKKFIDGSVKPYINNSLINVGGTKIQNIRLITTKEICNIINSIDSSNNCNSTTKGALTTMYKNVPSWLYSTYYWTMSPYASDSTILYDVTPTGSISVVYASRDGFGGTRPVIVISKSNIK